MKKKVILLAAIYLSVASGLSQVEGFRASGRFNGRFWEMMPKAQKTAYVQGFYDGWFLYTGNQNCPEVQVAVVDPYRTRLTFQEIVNEVDAFYREGANKPVPIAGAVRYAARKAGGAGAEDLANLAAELRRLAASGIR